MFKPVLVCDSVQSHILFSDRVFWVSLPWNLTFPSRTHASPMPCCERQLGVLVGVALLLESEITAILRCSKWISLCWILQSGFKVAIPHSHHPTGRTILLELGLCGWVLYHSSSPTCVPSKNQINKIYGRKPLYKCRGHTEQHVTNHFFTVKNHSWGASCHETKASISVYCVHRELQSSKQFFCGCFSSGSLCLEWELYALEISSWISFISI